MGLKSEPHEPSAECGNQHCHIHNVDEAADESTFRVCIECGHVFQTREDLERAWTDMAAIVRDISVLPFFGPLLPSPLLSMPADDITYCPHCISDFI